MHLGGQRLSRMYLDKKNLYLLLICGLFGTAPLWAVELKEAEITALKNIVEHDTGEGKGAAPAHASEKIYEKSKVSTAAASMAELTFADTSITRVGSNTSFSFQSKERLVKLDKGTILINTPPGAGGATVDCGGVTAAVTGTTFMASVDGNGNKMFVLLEGAGGMKVTAGGKTTIVRAGQAASVGGGDGGGKKEDSSGGPGEKKAGGDKPSADTKESGGSKEPGGDSAGAGDGGKPKAAAPTPAADKGPGEGSAGGGKPPAAPTIQVFDVDVQKVVASTPLIQAFEKPLPSAQKIQATVDVQQAKMSEGKMESLGVEIVAVKADGDVLVGTPKVVAEAPPKKEEPKADAPAKKEDVVAKKEEVAGKKEDVGMKPEPKADPKMAGGPAPDNLDISTAAGPGAGAPPAPSGTSVAAAIPPPPPAAPSIQPPPVNIGQIVNQRPQELAPIVLTVRANDASRAFGAPNPDFGFSITAGGLLAGHSVVTDLRTMANNFSEVSGGPFGITFEGLRILDGSGGNVTSRYNLTKVSGSLTIFQAEQSVNFALPSNLTFGTEAGLVAGVRGGVVSFEVLSGPAKIENGKLVPDSGTGTVVVKAVTPGDANYRGAEAQQTITLAKAGQTLSFGNGPALSLLTGGTYTAPIPTGGLSDLNLSILETDGRAVLGSDSITVGKIYGANSFTMRASASENTSYLKAQQELVIQIKEDEAGIILSNPLRVLAGANSIPLMAAFDKYFYFVSAVPGSTGALESYFINAPGVYDPAGTESRYIQLVDTQKVELATESQDFDFFAAQAIKMTDKNGNDNIFLKDSLSLTPSRKDLFFYANQVVLGKQAAGFSGSTSNPLAMDESFMEFWDGGWRDWAVLGGSVQGGVTLKLPSSKEKVGFVAGTGGISIQGVTVGANGAALEVLTSGNLLVQAVAFLDLSSTRATSFESSGSIQMGATTEELAALETSAGQYSTLGKMATVTLGAAVVGDSLTAQVSAAAQEALQEEKQVRIESGGSVSAAGEAISTGIAVVRSATGLEMRDVVIRGFGQIELAKGLGSDSLAPRVLVSGSSVRDFKIKELVGAFINADSKIQMAALDDSGELAGTMVVRNGLPVNRQLAGVLDKSITDSRKNLLVDAQTVSLAAKRLEFQNTTIAAMSAINARANTVLLNNANFTVISQNGMINFYTQQGLVNRTYGSEVGSDNGMLNFSGVNNFTIFNNSFTVRDQATLNQHYGSNILDINQNGNRPEAGKVNVLKM